jgi:protein-tyrosine sulfotransferase
VLLGFPRSGTTMLRRLLGGHPQLCCPPETHILRSCAAFLHEDESPLGHRAGVLTSLRFCGVQPNQVLDGLRTLAFGLFQEICKRQNKPIWVEKSALDFFHIAEIEQLLEDRCRYIWIRRHAADVVSSVKEYVAAAEIYLPELHQYIQRYPAPLEAFAHAWADTQIQAADFADRHPQTCLAIDYEPLVADPEAGLQRILDFLGLEGNTAEMVEGLRKPPETGFGDWKTYERLSVTTESVGRSQSLPPRVLARVAEIVNPAMERIGYPPIEVAPQVLRTDPVREMKLFQSILHNKATKADAPSTGEG